MFFLTNVVLMSIVLKNPARFFLLPDILLSVILLIVVILSVFLLNMVLMSVVQVSVFYCALHAELEFHSA